MRSEEGNPLKKNFGDWWREKKAARKIKKAEKKFEKASTAAGDYHLYGGGDSNIKKAARKYRKGVKALRQAERAGANVDNVDVVRSETEDRIQGNYRNKRTR